MRDVKLDDGTRILIIERSDLKFRIGDLTHVRTRLETCRTDYDLILVLTSTKPGRSSLPVWMRDYPLRSRVGDFGNSFWIMEKDDQGTWKK